MATLTAKRGDNLRATFYFTENDEPANLSGCSARMQVRVKRLGTLLLDVSTDDYLTLDGVAGTVTCDVPAAEMDIQTGKHEADVELTYADGTVRTGDTFTVSVVQDVTRDDA